jgi:hypothetical protein
VAYETKEREGTLFVKADRQGKQPDFTGTIRIEGVLYRLAAWQRTTHSGATFLSLKASLPSDKPALPRKSPWAAGSSREPAPAGADFNDEMPPW